MLVALTVPDLTGDALPTPLPTPGAMVMLTAVCLMSCVLVAFRLRFPRATATALAAFYAVAVASGYGSFLAVPALVGMFALGRHARARDMAPCAALSLALIAAGSVVGASDDALGETIAALATFAVALILGGALAARAESRAAKDRELAARLRADAMQQQRDWAVSQSRVAAELHDSVGHGLTTIIALSEGLGGLADDRRVNEGLAGINEVARECLDQTREAVRALAPRGDSSADEPEKRGKAIERQSLTSPHSWNDILPVLAHARETGIAAALAETGRRPDDPEQADLAFAVSREALTNAMRHGVDVRSITVAWDHFADGSIRIAVRDDGRGTILEDGQGGDTPTPRTDLLPNRQPEKAAMETDASCRSGTGLLRLRERVEAAGGAFEAGPEETGWTVKAHLPPQADEGEADDRRHLS